MNNGITLDDYHFAGTGSCTGDCTDKTALGLNILLQKRRQRETLLRKKIQDRVQ